MAADNRSLARFELTGIPPAPRGVPKIQVTFRIDANGILDVEAQDMGTLRMQSVKVTAASGLTQEQIDGILADSEQYREADELRRELAEARNQAETLLYTTEQALDGYADLLDPETVKAVRGEAERVRRLLSEGGQLEAIREAYQQLEAAAFKIAESMYGSEE